MADFEFQAMLDAVDSAEGEAKAVVPKHALGLYSKGADGKFVLDADLAKRLDNTGLTSALDKERKSARELDKLVKAYQKHGKPEELEAKLEELAKGATSDKDKAQFEKLKADLLAGHQKELGARDEQLGKMKGTVEKYLIDSEATAALSELKGSPALLLPHVRNQVKVLEENGHYVARVVDSEGDPRGNGKGGMMTIKELVAEMRKHPEFSRAFEPSGTSGSGTPPGGQRGTPAGNTSKSSFQKIADGLKNNQR